MFHAYSSSSISGVSTYLETTLQTTPSWFATLRSSRSEGLQASSWSRMRSSPDRLSSSRSSRCASPSWRKIRQRRTCLQVICEMPALDIHSNEERHRFDLRDNTDQTRMFIKVKIASTGPFSRKTQCIPPLILWGNYQVLHLSKTLLQTRESQFWLVLLPIFIGICRLLRGGTVNSTRPTLIRLAVLVHIKHLHTYLFPP